MQTTNEQRARKLARNRRRHAVVEDEGKIEISARSAITLCIRRGHWPALTEEQIERFVAIADEAEREIT